MSCCAGNSPSRPRGRTFHLGWLAGLLVLSWFGSPLQAGVPVEPLFVLQGGLDQPSDVAVTDEGLAYVLDGVNDRVVVFGSEGRRLFTFGRRLHLPMGIATDGKRLYVADTGNHRIAVFDGRGRFLEAIPLDGDPPPEPVALRVWEDSVVWSDRRNHRVCRYDLRNRTTLWCRGGYGEGEGAFRFPFQVAVDRDGYVHVVDVLNGRVQVFHPRGRYFSRTGRFGLGPGELYRPNGLAFARDGQLFIGDSYRGTVSVFLNGRFQGEVSGPRGEPPALGVPVGLAVRRDRLYVVDAAGGRVGVYRLLPSGDSEPPTGETVRASRRDCAICHLSWAPGYVSGEGEQDGVVPVATPRMCYSCHHGVVIESRRAIGRGEQHPDIHHQRREKKQSDEQDEIPEIFPLVGDGKLSCGSCHTPHGSDPEQAVGDEREEKNRWMRISNRKGDLCHRCHESKLDDAMEEKRSRGGVNHPVGIFLEPPPRRGAEGYAIDRKLQRGLPRTLVEQGLRTGPARQMICQSCHRVHGAAKETLVPLTGDDSRLCIECHRRHYAGTREEARRKGIHPVDMKLEQPVRMGDEKIEKITCLTCHLPHDAVPGTPLLKFDHREGRLCSFCHDGYDAVADSDHDLRVTAPETRNRFDISPRKAGVCGGCHTMHRGDGRAPSLYAGPFRPWSGEEHALERDRICLDCHRENGIAEKATVQYFSHPRKDLVLRSRPEEMPLVNESGEMDEFGSIACITCHDPHSWTPAGKPDSSSMGRSREGNARNSFLRSRQVERTFCVACHGSETLVRYKYYHGSSSRDSAVDYIH